MLTFLYVDFLDTTGTLFSMANFMNNFIPGAAPRPASCSVYLKFEPLLWYHCALQWLVSSWQRLENVSLLDTTWPMHPVQCKRLFLWPLSDQWSKGALSVLVLNSLVLDSHQHFPALHHVTHQPDPPQGLSTRRSSSRGSRLPLWWMAWRRWPAASWAPVPSRRT
jgi:hypothetical protein